MDYSLIVFSRYREELLHYEGKYEVMRVAMRLTAKPVLFAGGTVFAAMIINIILVSRFLEERKKRNIKDALKVALRNTGGVMSSAGIILAATFAALMTMPIADLYVFEFIVALGIIIYTFLVRGMLFSSIILLFEKDTKQARAEAEV